MFLMLSKQIQTLPALMFVCLSCHLVRQRCVLFVVLAVMLCLLSKAQRCDSISVCLFLSLSTHFSLSVHSSLSFLPSLPLCISQALCGKVDSFLQNFQVYSSIRYKQNSSFFKVLFCSPTVQRKNASVHIKQQQKTKQSALPIGYLKSRGPGQNVNRWAPSSNEKAIAQCTLVGPPRHRARDNILGNPSPNYDPGRFWTELNSCPTMA